MSIVNSILGAFIELVSFLLVYACTYFGASFMIRVMGVNTSLIGFFGEVIFFVFGVAVFYLIRYSVLYWLWSVSLREKQGSAMPDLSPLKAFRLMTISSNFVSKQFAECTQSQEGIIWKVIQPRVLLNLLYYDSVNVCVMKYYYKYGQPEDKYVNVYAKALALFKENLDSCLAYDWKDFGVYSVCQILGVFLFRSNFTYSFALGHGRLGLLYSLCIMQAFVCILIDVFMRPFIITRGIDFFIDRELQDASLVESILNSSSDTSSSSDSSIDAGDFSDDFLVSSSGDSPIADSGDSVSDVDSSSEPVPPTDSVDN